MKLQKGKSAVWVTYYFSNLCLMSLVILMRGVFSYAKIEKGNGLKSCIVGKAENVQEEASKLLRSLRIIIMSKTISFFLTFYGGKRWTTSLHQQLSFCHYLDALVPVQMPFLMVLCFLDLQTVESCKKPSSVQMVKRLDFSNLLGLDTNLKNGRWACEINFDLLWHVHTENRFSVCWA